MHIPRKLLSLCCLLALGLFPVAAYAAAPQPQAEAREPGALPEGVRYEIEGENVRLYSEIDGVRVIETSPEMTTVYAMDKGDSRAFPLDHRTEVYLHGMTFDCHPDPSKCPTPKPIPSISTAIEGPQVCLCTGRPTEEACSHPINECVKSCCGQ